MPASARTRTRSAGTPRTAKFWEDKGGSLFCGTASPLPDRRSGACGAGASTHGQHAARLDELWLHPRGDGAEPWHPRRLPPSGELQDAVLERAVADGAEVDEVVLLEAPRVLLTLLRQEVRGAVDVARLEQHQRHRSHALLLAGHDAAVAVLVEVAEQPDDEVGDQVGLERPGGVGVADREGEVGHAREHQRAVGEARGRVDLLAVDGELDVAEEPEVEA